MKHKIIQGALFGGLLVAATLWALSPKATQDITEADQHVVWPHADSPVKKSPEMEEKITALIAKMSVAEKVGQIIQPEIQYITPAEIKSYHIGSILNGGGSLPNRNKHATPAEWLALADAFYEASMDVSDGGVAIPILWGSDAIHGHSNVIGATIFPHNIGLGAMRDPDLVREIGRVTALEMRTTGIDWTFSPTLAVVQNDRWGRSYEGFSEDPTVVAAYAAPFVYGLQGVPGEGDFLNENHVIATAKHFLADGATENGDDQGDAKISERELRDIHAAGYVTALKAGVQTVMASFSSWQGAKIHGNKYLLTDVLKDQMGFDGPVVSDWNAHGQVPGCSNVSCAQSINAGIDIVMAPQDWKGLYVNSLAQVKAGDIPLTRLEDAVRRILRMKMRSGLFDKPRPSERGLAGRTDIIGRQAHRDIARKAVRQSLVLLKNNAGILPLRPDQTVLVVGDGADNIGKQAGGWTISWQGTGNKNSDFPGGQSIFDGIRDAVESVGGRAILDVAGTSEVRADVVIAVYGENPYAEFQGDLDSLEYQPGQKKDLQLLKSLKARGLPVVSVFLSGRPLWVNPEINASDAFVAAWLPGSQGAGIADVLIADATGKARHDFTGKLSFSWPKTPPQDVLNPHHENYDPQFALGYGLQYGSSEAALAPLPEDVEGVQKGLAQQVAIYAGRPLEPWRIYIGDGDTPQIMSGAYAALPEDRMVIRTADKDVQEDALKIIWSGKRPGRVMIDGGGSLDLSPYHGSGGILALDMKLDQLPEGEVYLSMACVEGCGRKIRLTDHLRALVGQDWQKVTVKLACFDADTARMTQVTMPFVLESEGRAALQVANIRVLPRGSAAFTCP